MRALSLTGSGFFVDRAVAAAMLRPAVLLLMTSLPPAARAPAAASGVVAAAAASVSFGTPVIVGHSNKSHFYFPCVAVALPSGEVGLHVTLSGVSLRPLCSCHRRRLLPVLSHADATRRAGDTGQLHMPGTRQPTRLRQGLQLHRRRHRLRATVDRARGWVWQLQLVRRSGGGSAGRQK